MNNNLREITERNDEYIEELRTDLLTLKEAAQERLRDSRLWVWQGDGCDFTRSMASDLPVLIRGADLRHLLKHGETVAED